MGLFLYFAMMILWMVNKWAEQCYRRLSSHLHGTYSKGHKGKTREIIQNGNIVKAIDNARTLEQRYSDEGKSILSNIKDMNPFSNVYKLIEQFMVEISEN